MINENTQREDNTITTNVEIAVSDKAMKVWTQVPAVVKDPVTIDDMEYSIKYLSTLKAKFEEQYDSDVLDTETPGTWIKLNDTIRDVTQKLTSRMSEVKASGELKVINEENGIVREEIKWVRFKTKSVDGESRLVPYVCAENYEVLLKYLDVKIRYNEMTKEEEFFTVKQVKDFHADTRDNAVMAWIANEGEHLDFKLPTEKHKGFITMVGNANAYHPIRDWIESKPWDGVSRAEEFLETVSLNTPNVMKDRIMLTWAVSAIAALYEKNGIKSQGFISFTGNQGIGKTSWVLSLVPDELKGAIGEGLILNPDKPDSVAQVVSHWIAELGEVGSTFRKADIDSLKSFITKDTDVFRPPYAARANKYVRRTIFFATVNDTEFLQDMTGNRRYWTLDVAKLNFKHNMDVQQFWAEIKSYYDDGGYLVANHGRAEAIGNNQQRLRNS